MELTNDGDILKCLQTALIQSHSSNDRVQLVSVFCAKDNDNKYIYTIAELLKLFRDKSKHLTEKARMHAAGGQAGKSFAWLSAIKWGYARCCQWNKISKTNKWNKGDHAKCCENCP